MSTKGRHDKGNVASSEAWLSNNAPLGAVSRSYRLCIAEDAAEHESARHELRIAEDEAEHEDAYHRLRTAEGVAEHIGAFHGLRIADHAAEHEGAHHGFRIAKDVAEHEGAFWVSYSKGDMLLQSAGGAIDGSTGASQTIFAANCKCPLPFLTLTLQASPTLS